MPYWAFLALAIVIHLIINFDTLRRPESKAIYILRPFKLFLAALLSLFISDFLWGIFEEAKLGLPLYIDTVFYFLFTGLTIFFWIHFVIAFLKSNKVFTRITQLIGLAFLVTEIVCIIVNFFTPIFFAVNLETADYVGGPARDILLYVQTGFYFILFVYTLIVTLRNKDKMSRRYFAISSFSLINGAFILIQTFDTHLPLYSMGLLIGICALHAFMVGDVRKELDTALKVSKDNEKIMDEALGSAITLAYTDPLTHIKNKHAYVEMEEKIDKLIAKDEIKEFGVIVFDLNGLKQVNDTLGHDAGDKYICDSVGVIEKYFGEENLYRFGGDEFVVILQNENYEKRKSLFASFNHQIDEAVDSDKPIISAGMSIYRRGQDNTYRAVFSRADKLMYSRKEYLKEHNV